MSSIPYKRLSAVLPYTGARIRRCPLYLYALWLLLSISVFTLFHDLFLGRIIATTDFITNDLLYYNYPLKSQYTEMLRQGHLLLWSPYIYSGFPVFAEGQGGFLYPINVILALLLPPLQAINAFLIIHAILMGAGAYKFAGMLCKSRWAAIPAGVAASICGSLVCGHTRHLNAYAVIALTPFLFAWVEEAARIRRWRQCLPIAGKIGLTGGFMALAGHPQFTFIAFSLTFCYAALCYLFGLKTRRIKSSKPAFIVMSFLIGCILALLIGFPQLRETADLMAVSGRHGRISAMLANQGSLPWSNAATFITPYFDGDFTNGTYVNMPRFYLFWEGYHYTGAIILLLALVGIVYGWRRRPPVRALTILAIICYLLSVGGNGFIYGYMRSLPVVGAFRFPGRWLLGTEIAVIVLSAYGLKAILIWLRIQRKRKTAKSPHPTPLLGKKREMLGFHTGLGPSICILAAIATICDIAFVSGHQIVTANVNELFALSHKTANNISSGEKLYTLGVEQIESYAYLSNHGWKPSSNLFGISAASLPSNLNAVYHITAVRGYSSLSLQYVSAVWGDQNNSGLIHYCYHPIGQDLKIDPRMVELLRLWNVGTIHSIWDLPPPFTLKNNIEGIRVYKVQNSNPRAWVTRELVSLPDNYQVQNAIQMLVSGRDICRTAFVNGAIPAVPQNASYGSVEILSDTGQSITLKVSSPGMVVLTDTWYPRWKATVDGKPAKIYRVNMAMRGVVAPHADSIIRMWYDTKNIVFWIVLSYLLMLSCIIMSYKDGRVLRV